MFKGLTFTLGLVLFLVGPSAFAQEPITFSSEEQLMAHEIASVVETFGQTETTADLQKLILERERLLRNILKESPAKTSAISTLVQKWVKSAADRIGNKEFSNRFVEPISDLTIPPRYKTLLSQFLSKVPRGSYRNIHDLVRPEAESQFQYLCLEVLRRMAMAHELATRSLDPTNEPHALTEVEDFVFRKMLEVVEHTPEARKGGLTALREALPGIDPKTVDVVIRKSIVRTSNSHSEAEQADAFFDLLESKIKKPNVRHTPLLDVLTIDASVAERDRSLMESLVRSKAFEDHLLKNLGVARDQITRISIFPSASTSTSQSLFALEVTTNIAGIRPFFRSLRLAKTDGTATEPRVVDAKQSLVRALSKDRGKVRASAILDHWSHTWSDGGRPVAVGIELVEWNGSPSILEVEGHLAFEFERDFHRIVRDAVKNILVTARRVPAILARGDFSLHSIHVNLEGRLVRGVQINELRSIERESDAEVFRGLLQLADLPITETSGDPVDEFAKLLVEQRPDLVQRIQVHSRTRLLSTLGYTAEFMRRYHDLSSSVRVAMAMLPRVVGEKINPDSDEWGEAQKQIADIRFLAQAMSDHGDLSQACEAGIAEILRDHWKEHRVTQALQTAIQEAKDPSIQVRLRALEHRQAFVNPTTVIASLMEDGEFRGRVFPMLGLDPHRPPAYVIHSIGADIEPVETYEVSFTSAGKTSIVVVVHRDVNPEQKAKTEATIKSFSTVLRTKDAKVLLPEFLYGYSRRLPNTDHAAWVSVYRMPAGISLEKIQPTPVQQLEIIDLVLGESKKAPGILNWGQFSPGAIRVQVQDNHVAKVHVVAPRHHGGVSRYSIFRSVLDLATEYVSHAESDRFVDLFIQRRPDLALSFSSFFERYRATHPEFSSTTLEGIALIQLAEALPRRLMRFPKLIDGYINVESAVWYARMGEGEREREHMRLSVLSLAHRLEKPGEESEEAAFALERLIRTSRLPSRLLREAVEEAKKDVPKVADQLDVLASSRSPIKTNVPQPVKISEPHEQAMAAEIVAVTFVNSDVTDGKELVEEVREREHFLERSGISLMPDERKVAEQKLLKMAFDEVGDPQWTVFVSNPQEREVLETFFAVPAGTFVRIANQADEQMEDALEPAILKLLSRRFLVRRSLMPEFESAKLELTLCELGVLERLLRVLSDRKYETWNDEELRTEVEYQNQDIRPILMDAVVSKTVQWMARKFGGKLISRMADLDPLLGGGRAFGILQTVIHNPDRSLDRFEGSIEENWRLFLYVLSFAREERLKMGPSITFTNVPSPKERRTKRAELGGPQNVPMRAIDRLITVSGEENVSTSDTAVRVDKLYHSAEFQKRVLGSVHVDPSTVRNVHVVPMSDDGHFPATQFGLTIRYVGENQKGSERHFYIRRVIGADSNTESSLARALEKDTSSGVQFLNPVANIRTESNERVWVSTWSGELPLNSYVTYAVAKVGASLDALRPVQADITRRILTASREAPKLLEQVPLNSNTILVNISNRNRVRSVRLTGVPENHLFSDSFEGLARFFSNIYFLDPTETIEAKSERMKTLVSLLFEIRPDLAIDIVQADMWRKLNETQMYRAMRAWRIFEELADATVLFLEWKPKVIEGRVNPYSHEWFAGLTDGQKKIRAAELQIQYFAEGSRRGGARGKQARDVLMFLMRTPEFENPSVRETYTRWMGQAPPEAEEDAGGGTSEPPKSGGSSPEIKDGEDQGPVALLTDVTTSRPHRSRIRSSAVRAEIPGRHVVAGQHQKKPKLAIVSPPTEDPPVIPPPTGGNGNSDEGPERRNNENEFKLVLAQLPKPLWSPEFMMEYGGYLSIVVPYTAGKLYLLYQEGKISKAKILEILTTLIIHPKGYFQFAGFVWTNYVTDKLLEKSFQEFLKSGAASRLAKILLAKTAGMYGAMLATHIAFGALDEVDRTVVYEDGLSETEVHQIFSILKRNVKEVDGLDIFFVATGFTIGSALVIGSQGLLPPWVGAGVGFLVGDLLNNRIGIPMRRMLNARDLESKMGATRWLLRTTEGRDLRDREVAFVPSRVELVAKAFQKIQAVKNAELLHDISEFQALLKGRMSGHLTRRINRKVSDGPVGVPYALNLEEKVNEVGKRFGELRQAMALTRAYLDDLDRRESTYWQSVYPKAKAWAEQFSRACRTQDSLDYWSPAVMSRVRFMSERGNRATFAPIDETIALRMSRLSCHPPGDLRDISSHLLNDREIARSQFAFVARLKTFGVNWLVSDYDLKLLELAELTSLRVNNKFHPRTEDEIEKDLEFCHIFVANIQNDSTAQHRMNESVGWGIRQEFNRCDSDSLYQKSRALAEEEARVDQFPLFH